ncbi:MAG: hypothetical protein OEZ02_14745, partial [Anaerolineae bacterium]|nr:hypothetical protein [Anaerolineae bacterium]
DNGDVSGVSSLMTATPPPTDESAAAATEEPTGEASAEATIEPTLEATATIIPPTETATQAPTATSTEIPVENTATPTFTPTQTLVPTAVPTLVAPVLPDEVASGIQKLQARIDSIRRLKSIIAPVSFQVSDSEVRQILERSLSASEISIWAENERQVYNFIGLSGHSYNLRNHYFNYWAEPQGGFYNPLTNGIYFTGFRFGGTEKYLFAQEYSQTLINKNFNTVGLGIFPTCTRGTETCSAIFAMMKGDAMLTADQWFSRDASSSERKEIEALPEKTFFISTIFPPPFASVDQDFPYVQGKAFVNELYRNGGWTRVNKAYANPPVTTEQILHFDKYVRAEQAVILEPAPLLSLLGSNWSEVKNESLGEWLTYLILAYPENEKAKIDKATAEKAAAGWGGDLAQVYNNHLENKSVGAFRWVWDTSRDAGEFSSALEEYMKHRYSNNVIDPIAGASCWEGVREVSCLVFSESGSLWVIGTHKALVEMVLGEYISGQ